MALFVKIGATVTRPTEKNCCYLARSLNTLRFPRVTRESPRSYLAVGSHFGTGTALTRPIENICDYSPHRKPWPLFPQDKECFGSFTSHEENWFVFSRSLRVFRLLSASEVLTFHFRDATFPFRVHRR